MLRTIILVVLTVAAFAGPAPRLAVASGRDLTLVPKSSPVAGERRLALVIGNAAYTGEDIHPLKNPINDANAMASTLQNLGFDVREICDADRDEIRDAVHDFADDIRQSPQNVVALLYYSGHGMQVDGKNYLVPIGFTMPQHAEDVGDYAYDMQKALSEMQSANARVNIVVLDACRSNPFDTSRGIAGKGLGKMEASGVYIAYATGEGQTADDNPDSNNGLYTENLLKALKTPGLDIHQVFQLARRDVWEASDHEQYPYDYDGLLSDDFYFDGKPSHVVHNDSPITPQSAGSEAKMDFDTGKHLYGQFQYTDAEAYLRIAVRLDPSNAKYQDILGHCLTSEQKDAEAESYFRKAVELDPTTAGYQEDLGDNLYLRQKYTDAEPYYRQAVELDPTQPLYQNQLGDDLYDQQKYADAETYDRKASELDPTREAYQEHVGNDLFQQQKYADAEPFFRQAIAIDSTDAAFQNQLGVDLYDQQKYTDALTYFQNAVQLDSSNTTYQTNLQACQQKLGKQ